MALTITTSTNFTQGDPADPTNLVDQTVYCRLDHFTNVIESSVIVNTHLWHSATKYNQGRQEVISINQVAASYTISFATVPVTGLPLLNGHNLWDKLNYWIHQQIQTTLQSNPNLTVTIVDIPL